MSKGAPTLVSGLANTAEANPDSVAVRLGEATLTYSELAARSGAVANALRTSGVRAGDRVGLLLDKSLHAVSAIWGIMRAGAGFVPINPTAPAAYVSTVIADCGIDVLITDDRHLTMVEGLDAEVRPRMIFGAARPDLPSLSWEEAYANDPLVSNDVRDTDLAYVLYTSGTTGIPKGIAHSQKSALAFASAVQATYGLGVEDRLTNHAPLHFDLSTFDLFGGALGGSEVVIVSEAAARFPASFLQILRENKVTVTYAVPFAFVQLLLRGGLERDDLPNLRWLVFAGEVFPTKHLRSLMSMLPETQFSNIYGPTETNGVTFFHVPRLDPKDDSPIPIGKPFPGMRAHIVDSGGRPVDEGEPGELLIDTETRMLGYWGREQLTSDATTRDSGLSPNPMHRTGDLVRQMADGNIELIGRVDRQIKTRGYRVELDEVEAVLAAHSAVEEAAVYTVDDGEGSHEIRAVVRLQLPSPEIEVDLKRHVSQSLPRYSVPTVIDTIDEMPRTSTGKVDRNSLIDNLTTKEPANS